MRARFITNDELHDYDTLHFFTLGRKGGRIGSASASTEKAILEAFVSPFWNADKYQILWEDMDTDDREFTAQAVMNYEDLKKLEEDVGAIQKPKIEAGKLGIKTTIYTETEEGVTTRPMKKAEIVDAIYKLKLKEAIIVAVDNKRDIRRKLHELLDLEKREKIASAGVTY